MVVSGGMPKAIQNGSSNYYFDKKKKGTFLKAGIRSFR